MYVSKSEREWADEVGAQLRSRKQVGVITNLPR